MEVVKILVGSRVAQNAPEQGTIGTNFGYLVSPPHCCQSLFVQLTCHHFSVGSKEPHNRRGSGTRQQLDSGDHIYPRAGEILQHAIFYLEDRQNPGSPWILDADSHSSVCSIKSNLQAGMSFSITVALFGLA